MDIFYTNKNMSLSDFWGWLEGLNCIKPNNDRHFLRALEQSNQEEFYTGNFRVLLDILSLVRHGTVNPIGLRIRLKRRIYLIDPNGNLFLEKATRVKFSTLKLDDMLARIGKG